jgi:hypothetical protein
VTDFRVAQQAVELALQQFRLGEPITAQCHFSNDALVVTGSPPGGPFTQWDVRCPCGKSNSVFKGL